MKRLLSILLILSLLLPVWGCSASEKNTAAFYYRRVEFQYGSAAEDGVITSEDRAVSGHTEDISYVIALYLMGPQDDDLASPFPPETKLIDARFQGGELHIRLSDVTNVLSDSQYALGCGCLAMTCMEITDIGYVTISSGARSIRMGRDSLTLLDDETVNPATIETTMEDPQ